jgi:hypothetical protein
MTLTMNGRRRIALATVQFVAASGCVSTSLDLPRDHPANPKAPTVPLVLSQPLGVGAAEPAAAKELPASHVGHPGEEHGGAQQSKPETKPETGDVWTCPMHPEIVRPGPGQCPTCGMNLVKKAKSPQPKGDH